MNTYEHLLTAEHRGCHTIEIEEPATGKVGVANSANSGVAVFYGLDDGSEDTTITPEDFNARFIIQHQPAALSCGQLVLSHVGAKAYVNGVLLAVVHISIQNAG